MGDIMKMGDIVRMGDLLRMFRRSQSFFDAGRAPIGRKYRSFSTEREAAANLLLLTN
jgi:hypothetical protein